MAAPSPPAPPKAPPRPNTFLIALVVVAVVVASVVGYLGISGKLGGGIPGTKPGSGSSGANPALCEGKGGTGPFFFSFVGGVGGTGGANSGLNFNGSSPGPCVDVAVGSSVTVNFTVASDAGMNHSWTVVNYTGATSIATEGPAFPGAGLSALSERQNGTAPGRSNEFEFTAERTGSFRYICEMPGHYAAGMWGWFNVTAVGAT